MYLFLLTCARPWGQGQESAAVPAGGGRDAFRPLPGTLAWVATMQRPWSPSLRECLGPRGFGDSLAEGGVCLESS